MTAVALLVCGPPASGKTTLARVLAEHVGACLLDLDVVTGALTEAVGKLVGSTDLDSPAFAGDLRAARYECLVAAAEDNLRLGRPVVLVAPFTAERTSPRAWQSVRDRMIAAGGRPNLVWLRVSRDELVRRLRARGADRDAAKLADPDSFLLNHSVAAPVVEHVAVDALDNVSDQVARILAAIT
jgi:predicted kinase